MTHKHHSPDQGSEFLYHSRDCEGLFDFLTFPFSFLCYLGQRVFILGTNMESLCLGLNYLIMSSWPGSIPILLKMLIIMFKFYSFILWYFLWSIVKSLNDLMTMVCILFVAGDGEQWCDRTISRTARRWSIVKKKWVCDTFLQG